MTITAPVPDDPGDFAARLFGRAEEPADTPEPDTPPLGNVAPQEGGNPATTRPDDELHAYVRTLFDSTDS